VHTCLRLEIEIMKRHDMNLSAPRIPRPSKEPSKESHASEPRQSNEGIRPSQTPTNKPLLPFTSALQTTRLLDPSNCTSTFQRFTSDFSDLLLVVCNIGDSPKSCLKLIVKRRHAIPDAVKA